MKKNFKYILIFFIVVASSFLFFLLDEPKEVQESNEIEIQTPYKVNRVVDGDTIKVEIDGKYETVRLLGINTPEVDNPNTKEECYGPEASAYLKKLLDNQSVYLLADQQNKDRDKYNRLLRYVYMQDGTFVEEELLRNGYAYNYPYFPFKFMKEFSDWEQEARENDVGLWRKCEKNK